HVSGIRAAAQQLSGDLGVKPCPMPPSSRFPAGSVVGDVAAASYLSCPDRSPAPGTWRSSVGTSRVQSSGAALAGGARLSDFSQELEFPSELLPWWNRVVAATTPAPSAAPRRGRSSRTRPGATGAG